jgi:hypothetical protein
MDVMIEKLRKGGVLGLAGMVAIVAAFAATSHFAGPVDYASAQAPYDLSLVSKTSSTGNEVAVGETFRWSITLGITGAPPAGTMFTLNDTIPAAFDVVGHIEDERIDCLRSGSGGRVFVCTGATTAADAGGGNAEHGLLHIDVVPNGTLCGERTNTATLTEGGSNATNNAAGDSITVQCTGSIVIVKDTNPESDDVEFDFDGSFDFQLEDDESVSLTGLGAGTFTISEDEHDDYRLVDIDCSAGADADISVSSETLELNLTAGEEVECVFVNERKDGDDDDEQVVVIVPEFPQPLQGGADVPQPAAPSPLQQVAPQTQVQTQSRISPPSTGDAGLAGDKAGSSTLLTVLGLVVAGSTVVAASRVVRLRR